jgi:hypothetical protein
VTLEKEEMFLPKTNPEDNQAEHGDVDKEKPIGVVLHDRQRSGHDANMPASKNAMENSITVGSNA